MGPRRGPSVRLPARPTRGPGVGEHVAALDGCQAEIGGSISLHREGHERSRRRVHSTAAPTAGTSCREIYRSPLSTPSREGNVARDKH